MRDIHINTQLYDQKELNIVLNKNKKRKEKKRCKKAMMK